MKAQEYLKARGIDVAQLESTSVGRLSIDAEFKFAGKRGVVVSPKRGSLSDRYISLLAAEGVFFVVAEGGSVLSFYETPQKGKGLISVRALKPMASKPFPTEALFDYLSSLLKQSTKRRELMGSIISNILLARLADEKAGTQNEWDCSIAGSAEDCQSLLKRVVGKLKKSDITVDGVLRLCALLTGFRLTSTTPAETALLIDWVARSIDDKKCIHGLPLVLAPVFQAIGEKSGSASVVTTAVGSQFSVLSGAKSDVVVLENGSQELLSILQTLFPGAHMVADNYLESTIGRQTDAVILIPPFGRSMLMKTEMPSASSFFKEKVSSKKYPAEYLYTFKAIEQCKTNGIIVAAVPEGILSGASHRAFRDWLLDTVQILGVVSLPAGFCFSGTAIRCSILLIKKADSLPSDYSISMIEVRAEDFEADALAGTIEAIKEMLQLEGHA